MGLAHLLKPANVKELDAILTYHVVSGVAAFSKDLTDGEKIKTVEGQSVVAHVSAAGVMINDATVKTADIAASNGVVHIIDTVLSIPEYKLHHVDSEDHKCFEATSASLFASKGITDSGACPASYNTIDKSVVVEQCPDGVTSIRYCSPIKVTIDSKGQAMMNSWTKAPAGKTIVDLAVATADLSTLVAALKAGGLVETLSGKGPFTVFAPTNEAFAKLPPATLAHLLKPANVKELDAILTYHVVSGVAAFSKDLTDGEKIKTVEGQSVVAHVSAAGVMINGATVQTADIAASNGVIHIIVKVLSLPPAPAPVPTKNIVQLASSVADLSTLVTALVAGKLTPALSGKGPFTVFAPTNEAFAALPKATLAHLL